MSETVEARLRRLEDIEDRLSASLALTRLSSEALLTHLHTCLTGLYHRVAVLRVHVPPLRERADDRADRTDGLAVMSVEDSLPADPDAFYAQPLAPVQHPVEELVAFRPVLAEQGAQVLDGRRLERLEAERLVHRLHHRDHVASPRHVGGQEVAHAARRLGRDLAHRRMV